MKLERPLLLGEDNGWIFGMVQGAGNMAANPCLRENDREGSPGPHWHPASPNLSDAWYAAVKIYYTCRERDETNPESSVEGHFWRNGEEACATNHSPKPRFK